MSVWDLNGRKALVTGGARGLGQAMAEALTRAGAAVMIGDVLDELGAETAQLLAKDGATAGFTHLDVTDEASWETAVAATVAELGAAPFEILAITFTNKAAQEMRSRVEQLLGHGTRGMWLMTFHAACARMLRADAERLGYTRQFTIYDQADARRLTKRCIDELGLDPKRYTLRSAPDLLAKSKAWEGYDEAARPLKDAIQKLG